MNLTGISYLCASAFICGSIFAAPPEPKFRPQTIDDKIQIGYGVAAADVDGDGKTDILLADKKQFVWYRNPTWQKFLVAENLTQRDNVCLAAQDLDGDGKCELAVGADWDPNDRETSGAVFYMIPPADRTQKWEPVKLHAEPTVHRMKWAPDRSGLIVVPLHGRGKDGAAASRVLLYERPEDPRRPWKTEILAESMHQTHNFDIAQSLLLAGREGVLNFDRGKPPTIIISSQKGVGEVRKLNESWDAIATVEPMHGNELVLYSREHRIVLTDKLVEGHALACGDVCGSGGLDQIVVGWRGGDRGIEIFTSLTGVFEHFRESPIDSNEMACEDLCLADLNGDKKLDIIASGRATHNVKIYWNETPP